MHLHNHVAEEWDRKHPPCPAEWLDAQYTVGLMYLKTSTSMPCRTNSEMMSALPSRGLSDWRWCTVSQYSALPRKPERAAKAGCAISVGPVAHNSCS